MKSKAEWRAAKAAKVHQSFDRAAFAESYVDFHDSELIEWLAMEGSMAYADEALEELGATEGILNILWQGQFLELLDIWDEIYK